MIKQFSLFKKPSQKTYLKLPDLDFEEEFILVWCANEQMAVLIHENKPTLRKRIIKKFTKKKRSLARVSHHRNYEIIFFCNFYNFCNFSNAGNFFNRSSETYSEIGGLETKFIPMIWISAVEDDG